MKKTIILIGATVLMVLFILFDLGFFWSLFADGKMDIHSSGGRFQYSVIRHAQCTFFSPEKTYRPIDHDAWMSEVKNGYWCKSDEEIEQFRARI